MPPCAMLSRLSSWLPWLICVSALAALPRALLSFESAFSSQVWRRRPIWTISFGISWTYAFLSSLSAGQSKRYCSSRPALRDIAPGWANLTAPEYGYKEFHAPPHCSLKALPGRNDEQQDYSRHGGDAGAGAFDSCRRRRLRWRSISRWAPVSRGNG